MKLDETSDLVLLNDCAGLLERSLIANHKCVFSNRYYSATIIKMSGVRDESDAIWLAAGTAFINFIFTVVAVFLVERLGRRKLIIGSLAG